MFRYKIIGHKYLDTARWNTIVGTRHVVSLPDNTGMSVGTSHVMSLQPNDTGIIVRPSRVMAQQHKKYE
jgi:hypothetical protein